MFFREGGLFQSLCVFVGIWVWVFVCCCVVIVKYGCGGIWGCCYDCY